MCWLAFQAPLADTKYKEIRHIIVIVFAYKPFKVSEIACILDKKDGGG